MASTAHGGPPTGMCDNTVTIYAEYPLLRRTADPYAALHGRPPILAGEWKIGVHNLESKKSERNRNIHPLLVQ